MILVDTGPLVALLRADDQHHVACVAAIKTLDAALGTVWPVLTEAMFLLAPWPAAQQALWRKLEEGAVRLLPLSIEDVPRVRELMWKYRDLPIDLADAALVRVAERERIATVFTVDRRDFAIYRPAGIGRFHIVP